MATPKVTHRWAFTVTPEIRDDIRKLQKRDRAAVFRTFRELLVSENPFNNPNIKKLEGEQFDGIRRHEAGDFRILYDIEVGEIIVNKYSYKGTILFLRVVRRNEKSYRR